MFYRNENGISRRIEIVLSIVSYLVLDPAWMVEELFPLESGRQILLLDVSTRKTVNINLKRREQNTCLCIRCARCTCGIRVIIESITAWSRQISYQTWSKIDRLTEWIVRKVSKAERWRKKTINSWSLHRYKHTYLCNFQGPSVEGKSFYKRYYLNKECIRVCGVMAEVW